MGGSFSGSVFLWLGEVNTLGDFRKGGLLGSETAVVSSPRDRCSFFPGLTDSVDDGGACTRSGAPRVKAPSLLPSTGEFRPTNCRDCVFRDIVGLGCLNRELIFVGCMIPGEYEDKEVGVDVLLLHGPGESEYLVAVEGLLAEVKFGVGGGRLITLTAAESPVNSFGTSKTLPSSNLLSFFVTGSCAAGVGIA